MNDIEYQETSNKIRLIVPLLLQMRLKEFLERIAETDALAPMLDPTLYRKGQQALEDQAEIARALYRAKKAITEQAMKEAKRRRRTA
jgi:hypothetical protein